MNAHIDKAACLAKIGTPKLDPESGLLYVQQVKYVVTTEIRIISHRRLLLLHYILRENAMRGNFQPDYTIVQATDDYVTYDHRPEAKTRWRTCMYNRLERRYDFDVDCAFYSHSDELRVNRFCRWYSDEGRRKGFRALYAMQITIREARELRKRKARERMVIQRMKPVSPIGKRFVGWAFHDALPTYIFYDYSKGARIVKGFCTGCCETVEVAGAKHNAPAICPHCGASATFKCRSRSSKLYDQETAQILQQVSESKLILRVFKLSAKYRTDFPQYEIHESARYFLSWDEHGKMTSDDYYNSYDGSVFTPWRSGERPVILGHYETYESGKTGHLYTRGLRNTLKGTPWQYCQLDHLYLAVRRPMDVYGYLREFHRVPFVEYLVKLNLTELACDAIYKRHSYGSWSTDKPAVVNERGKNLKEILGVGMDTVPLLQSINANNIQLGFVQDMRRMGIQPDPALLTWCGEHDISKLQDILVPLRYTTAHKLMRYVEEQFASHRRRWNDWGGKGYSALFIALSDYRDYLELCDKLSFDMKNSIVLFPRDLIEAHNKAVALADKKKRESYEREIAVSYPEWVERYAYEKDGMLIMPPKSSAEIVAEGQALHHCVGDYVERVANKECVILFLREADRPDKPFCTLEVKDAQLLQARGEWNHDPTKEAKIFLDRWKANVLNKQDARNHLLAVA